ncbi:MAG: 23S rRNA (adenine(1618)-N(6))-methyltransferase RlmF [Opitutaceae bacterium]|nr:23S rRNA (adenine(1618)-N(6))-methyltransferase RlmF [Opitutaceae bacterium]
MGGALRPDGSPREPAQSGHKAPLTTPNLDRKPGLHPRNPHAAGYDFPALVRRSPELAAFVHPNPVGRDTIDFADPAAVVALNRGLLRHHYGIEHWEIPPGYLCPPIPGRADYVHHLADLLGGPRGPAVRILDLGTGANGIYPLLGVAAYGWSFTGTDIDSAALANLERIVAANPALAGRIELRLQCDPRKIFAGVTAPDERFAACMCNPPFHASAAEADASTRRKLRNLGLSLKRDPARNFGGSNRELWCEGGEAAFVRRMIAESATRHGLCRWFTTLVSKDEHVPGLHGAMRAAGATALRTIDLAHGQKRGRILAWTFMHDPAAHRHSPDHVATAQTPRR